MYLLRSATAGEARENFCFFAMGEVIQQKLAPAPNTQVSDSKVNRFSSVGLSEHPPSSSTIIRYASPKKSDRCFYQQTLRAAFCLHAMLGITCALPPWETVVAAPWGSCPHNQRAETNYHLALPCIRPTPEFKITD